MGFNFDCPKHNIINIIPPCNKSVKSGSDFGKCEVPDLNPAFQIFLAGYFDALCYKCYLCKLKPQVIYN